MASVALWTVLGVVGAVGLWVAGRFVIPLLREQERQERERYEQWKEEHRQKRALKPDCSGCGEAWYLCRSYNRDLCPVCGKHRGAHSENRARLCAAEILAKAGIAPREG